MVRVIHSSTRWTHRCIMDSTKRTRRQTRSALSSWGNIPRQGQLHGRRLRFLWHGHSSMAVAREQQALHEEWEIEGGAGPRVLDAIDTLG
ncbi:hypothetical protein PF005_g10926 [Phytophthora fragariae]|uniref:Uncharacterized protein n=1 Tax=Phytophthora fragariae TaxID=53985 RepID=A0A6A3F0L2_9STRA|nr:hypothetical protein PF003_g28923 [Phytophthora fragariae]KAE8939245.1 hypothetical protein PF009_g10902 [Phytophthora fragariae]KAE9111225.1 hypothetical protein PF010_g10889 [Phytophthora fragariae]KAE9113090.1 hypothetical protein PF007_g10851 [Phytophthora fragariae]KAE9144837.1 hypothetical protein PF006_g10266 [Phytophthora fragariae]